MADVFLCGTVVEKNGTLERFCTNEAVCAIPLTDEDDLKVIDGICLCQLHSDRFDEGKSLMVKSRKGQHMLIQIDLNADPMPDTINEQGEPIK